jgi:CubicO group peptidase (beta-lactamase class C family)
MVVRRPGILTKATGKPLDQLARETLFELLGIRDVVAPRAVVEDLHAQTVG